MSTYTRVNWADGSGGGTAISVQNMGNMDDGIYNLYTDLAAHRSAAGAHSPMARIAVGNYTGDGTSNRLVSTGSPLFVPRFVQIGSSTYVFFALMAVTLALRLTKSTLDHAQVSWPIVPGGQTTGFQVGDTANTNGTSYTWIAMA